MKQIVKYYLLICAVQPKYFLYYELFSGRNINFFISFELKLFIFFYLEQEELKLN
jgi:hypothetical protein